MTPKGHFEINWPLEARAEIDYVQDFLKKKSSSGFQYSERTIASTERNDTSAKSAWSKLSFKTLKMIVA